MKQLTVNYPKGNMILTCYDDFYVIKDEKGFGRIEHSRKDKSELVNQLQHEINVYNVELTNPMHEEDKINRINIVIDANKQMIDFLEVI